MGGRLKLGQILVSKGLIGPEQLAAALGEQEQWGSRLGMTLVRMGFLDEETLVRVLAGQLRLPVARIRGKSVDAEILELVSVELAEKHRCLPLFVREEAGANTLFLAMEDPSDLEAIDEIAFQIGEKLRPVLVPPSELEAALKTHYHGQPSEAAPEPLGPVKPPAKPEETPETPAETARELPPLDLGLDPLLEGPDLHDPEPAPEAPDLHDPKPASEGPDLYDPEPVSEAPDLHDPKPAPAGPDLYDPEPVSAGPDLHDPQLEGPSLEDPMLDDPALAETKPDELQDDFDEELSFEPPEPEPPGPEPAAGEAPAIEPRVILRALSQLLVDKGVITRDEFAERVRRVADEESGAD